MKRQRTLLGEILPGETCLRRARGAHLAFFMRIPVKHYTFTKLDMKKRSQHSWLSHSAGTRTGWEKAQAERVEAERKRPRSSRVSVRRGPTARHARAGDEREQRRRESGGRVRLSRAGPLRGRGRRALASREAPPARLWLGRDRQLLLRVFVEVDDASAHAPPGDDETTHAARAGRGHGTQRLPG
jgi:hypothetical protein